MKILRLKQDGDRDALAIARRAARVAEAALTKGYFLRGAILSIFKRLPASSQTKVFCSQLVVYAYRESGLELFPGVRPEKTSPGMLADLAKANSGYPALLKDVTGSVLHLETEPLLIPPDVLDEGIDDDTPHTREVEIMRAVVKRLSKSFRCLGLVEPPTFEDALMKLANLKGEVAHAIDEEFSKALEEERYLKLFDYFYFVAYKEPALQLDSIVNDVLTKRTRTQLEALLHYYERRLAVRMADVRHRTLQVQAFRAQYEKTGFRTVGQLLEGYESTLQLQ